MKSVSQNPYRTLIFALSVAAALLLTGCAAKVNPTYFPALPAAPRIQLLTQFNNAGTLKNNRTLQMIIGDDLSDGFSKPYGLAFHDGRLFVADSGKTGPSIAIVDFTTRKIERISTGINKPVNIAVDADGTIFVCDMSENMVPGIAVYNAQNQFLRRMTLDIDNYRPAAALPVGDKLYVADVRNDLIRVLDKQSGVLLQTLGANDGLGWPIHLSLTPEGNLLVTETGAQSLRLLSPSGEVLARIGKPGDRAGTFMRPKATAVDREGHIYAVDVAFQNVQILEQTGQALLYFGQTTDPNQTLIMPAGIAITYDRLDVFQKYAAPGFTLEYVIAVSSQGSPNAGAKITLYGYGKLAGSDYTVPEAPTE